MNENEKLRRFLNAREASERRLASVHQSAREASGRQPPSVRVQLSLPHCGSSGTNSPKLKTTPEPSKSSSDDTSLKSRDNLKRRGEGSPKKRSSSPRNNANTRSESQPSVSASQPNSKPRPPNSPDPRQLRLDLPYPRTSTCSELLHPADSMKAEDE